MTTEQQQPLGIADLFPQARSILHGEYWLWCRSHEQAHKVGYRCVSQYAMDRGISEDFAQVLNPCVDVGPFMSEREACRLDTDPVAAAEQSTFSSALGMKIER